MRERYLTQLGIERWVRRSPVAPVFPDTPAAGVEPAGADSTAVESGRGPFAVSETAGAETVIADTVGTGAGTAEYTAAEGDQEPVAALDWTGLRSRVLDCERCHLARSRTQPVFGVGNLQADWLIIGEAPGAEEDVRGEPFVGRAGQLLNSMLAAIGLPRESVYIANILKCRPPQNRNPSSDEIRCCAAYLQRQIALIRPRIILALGRVAANNLLDNTEALGRMRGKVWTYGDTGIPVVVTYHPAYLLRKLAEKAKSWQDLQYAQRVLTTREPSP